MKTYTLKQSGFSFGQKRGKNEAIKALNLHLDFIGIPSKNRAWEKTHLGFIVHIKDSEHEVYTIEEIK